jgi:hypothetical protein
MTGRPAKTLDCCTAYKATNSLLFLMDCIEIQKGET